MAPLNDNQLEAIRRLVAVSELLRARGGTKISLNWEDYRVMAGIMKRITEVLKNKDFGDQLEQGKQDLAILVNMANQARSHGLLSWDEGAMTAQAIEVFQPAPQQQREAVEPPSQEAAKDVEVDSEDEGVEVEEEEEEAAPPPPVKRKNKGKGKSRS